MSDPFRSLHQIDPPDQWDDIVDRAGHDTEVRLLDDSPRRRPLRQARTWVAAAAVLALVGGGIALASGGDDPDGVATDPTSAPTTESQPAGEGCTYAVEMDPGIPQLEPGRHQVEPELGILPGPIEPRFGHGEIDGLLVEVGVGTGMTTAAAPTGVEPGGVRTGREGDAGFVEVAGLKDSDAPAPCDQVAVVVRKALTADQLAEIEAEPPVRPLDVTDLNETLDAVLAAVIVRDLAAEQAGRSTEPVTIDGPCPFTVATGAPVPDVAAGRVPVEPELGILPGPIEPTFAHGEVDDVLVEVAVGTGIDTASPPSDDSLRSGIEGETGWVEIAFVDETRRDGPCSQTVVVVRVPMRAEDVASGGRSLDFETYSDLAFPFGDGLLTAVTLDADGSSTPPDPTPPRIEGTLADGSPFEVWEDPGHGLCASLRDVILGCDDVGPVISPDADPSTPRLGIDECCPPLWFGYLPEGAVDVVLGTASGERLDVEAVLGDGIWALPVPAEHARDDGFDSDTVVTYVMDDGSEVPAPHVG